MNFYFGNWQLERKSTNSRSGSNYGAVLIEHKCRLTLFKLPDLIIGNCNVCSIIVPIINKHNNVL